MIVGIDPGISGAVAIIDVAPRPYRVRLCCDLPLELIGETREIDVAKLAGWVQEFNPVFGVIERAFAMPSIVDKKTKKRRDPGSASAFNYGAAYGECRAVLKGLGIPFQRVMPGQWKAGFGIAKDKDIARALAAELFPHDARLFDLAKSEHRAEAALIALFGAKKFRLDLFSKK